MFTKKYLYFVTVVQSGNISRAAKALNMSQPPLSMYIKQIEEELGEELIVRGSRFVKLTPAGELFYEIAKKILSYEKQIEKEIKNKAKGSIPAVKVGIISSVTDIAVKALSELRNDIRYSIIEANTYELLDKIKTNDIDLAIIRTPYIMSNHDFRNLKDDALCLYGDLSNLDINSINDLDELPLIIYRRWEAVLNDKFQQANISANITMICDDARTCIAAADNGMGIAIVPKSIPATKKDKLIIPFKITDSSIHIIKGRGESEPTSNYIYNNLELND